MSGETKATIDAERLEMAIDRLDSFVASLVNLKTIPASIHVAALREALPEIAKELRAVLKEGEPQ